MLEFSPSKLKSNQASTVDTKVKNMRQLSPIKQEIQPENVGSLLDSKVIEKWIDSILFEVNKSNLKKYGIDRKTLRSIGILPEDVNRLFRCLFIYSFGFYEMLKELVKNQLITIQIWKVFGVLLEYSSNFQFTINQIQQEHKFHINQMQELLNLKEKELSEYELRQQDKLAKFNTDLILQKQENETLSNQKNELMSDYNSANQQLDNEVALRVRFEYKINEVYGIHKELQLKYNILVEDLAKYKTENEKLLNDLHQCRKDNDVLQIEKKQNVILINDLSGQNQMFSQNLKDREVILLDLEAKVQNLMKTEIKDYNHQRNQEHLISTLQMQLQELQANYENNKKSLETYKTQNKELKLSNVTILTDLSKCSETLSTVQRDLLTTTIKADHLAKIELGLRNSLATVQEENTTLLTNNQELAQSHKRLEVDLQFSEQKVNLCNTEISALNTTITSMKNQKNYLDEEYIQEKVKSQQLNDNLASKIEIIDDLEKCLSYSQNKLHALTIELTDVENQRRFEIQEKNNAKQNFESKITFLEECLANLQSQILSEKDKLERQQIAYETQKNQFNELNGLYKVQIFENNSLVTKSIFLNRVIDNERQRNQELITEITEFKLQLENQQREYNCLSLKQQDQKEIAKQEKNFIVKRFMNQIADYKSQMKELTFKMYLEDSISELARKDELLSKCRINNFELTRQNNQLLDTNNVISVKLNDALEQLQDKTDKLDIMTSDFGELKQKYKRSRQIFRISQEANSSTRMELQEFTQRLGSLTTLIGDLQTQLAQSNLEVERQKNTIKQYRQKTLTEKVEILDDVTVRKQEPKFKRQIVSKKCIAVQPMYQNGQDIIQQSFNQAELQMGDRITNSKSDTNEQIEIYPQSLNAIHGFTSITSQRGNSLISPITHPMDNSVIYQDANNGKLKLQANMQHLNNMTTIQASTRRRSILLDDKMSKSRSISQRSQRDSESSQNGKFSIKTEQNRQKRQLNTQEFSRLYQITSKHYQM